MRTAQSYGSVTVVVCVYSVVCMFLDDTEKTRIISETPFTLAALKPADVGCCVRCEYLESGYAPRSNDPVVVWVFITSSSAHP